MKLMNNAPDSSEQDLIDLYSDASGIAVPEEPSDDAVNARATQLRTLQPQVYDDGTVTTARTAAREALRQPRRDALDRLRAYEQHQREQHLQPFRDRAAKEHPLQAQRTLQQGESSWEYNRGARLNTLRSERDAAAAAARRSVIQASETQAAQHRETQAELNARAEVLQQLARLDALGEAKRASAEDERASKAGKAPPERPARFWRELQAKLR